MSQASAKFTPAPAAAPFTAQTIGFGKLRNRANEGIVALVERLAQVGAGSTRRDRAIGQIGSGAKTFAGARHHDDAALLIRRRTGDRSGERVVQGGVEGVQSPRPVQGQRQHAAIKRVDQNRLRCGVRLFLHERPP